MVLIAHARKSIADTGRQKRWSTGAKFFAGHHIAPQEGQREATNTDEQNIFPTPDDGVVDGVHADTHKREGQEHEPDADQERSHNTVHNAP